MNAPEIIITVDNLTKRELFAAMAMQSVIGLVSVKDCVKYSSDETRQMIAVGAVAQADALLAELHKEQ
jgi:hypothetical protein